MRLLSLIFPSNYPGFNSDSIYVFNKILLRSMIDLAPSVKVSVAGPADMPPMSQAIKQYSFRTGIDKFHVRFGFAWDEIRHILELARPDIILVNMPEQAAAIAVLAHDDLKQKCRIISYVHYVPATISGEGATCVDYEQNMNLHGNGRTATLRLLEGLIASDCAIIGAEFGARLVSQLASALLGPAAKLPELKILPPPVDITESAVALTAELAPHPRLVYNHRLYDEYGTHLVFDMLTELSLRTRKSFEVVVTHPTAGRDLSRQRLNNSVEKNLRDLEKLPYIRVSHFTDRAAYFRMLGSSWAGIAPHKPNALWSMSIIDLLSAGRRVVAFDIGAFGQMGLPAEDIVSSRTTFIDRIESIIDQPPGPDQAAFLRTIAEGYSGRTIADKLLTLIDV